jgi:hypothetical protein
MKALACLVTLACAVAPASAQPRGMSQHPRVGLLAELRFDAGSTRLPEASGSRLGRIAAWADENYDGLLVLDTHADTFGPGRSNVRLSLRRARIVRDQLVALGVDPNQIVIAAFGPEGKGRARVAIWGTHNSLDQVMAARERRGGVTVPPYQDRAARRPTLSGHR